MYDADAAREALDEAKRFEKSDGTEREKSESWELAAQQFEVGLTQDRFAASQSISCWRKARNLAKAVECAETALELFGGDPWVRSNAAWVQYDKLKQIGRNLDEALPVLERMLDLMRGLNDVGVLADQAAFRLRSLVPRGNSLAPPDVLDLLVRHFEQLFDGCQSLKRDGKESPKQQLADFAATHLEAQERWDDLVPIMRRVIQAYPREPKFARLYVRSLLEMEESQAALEAAKEAQLEVLDADLVRLQAGAWTRLGNLDEAARTLVTGCYRFPAVIPMWRHLAQVRWQQGDIVGSNRALAVALRQVSKSSAREQREWASRLHQGRAAGWMRIGEVQKAAQEAAAARIAYERDSEEPEPALGKIVEQIVAKDATALDVADDLAEAGKLDEVLADMYATEREQEIESSLREADVVHLDLEKGFGYLVFAEQDDTGGAASPEEQAERIYFEATAFQGDPSHLSVGSRVRMFATPLTNADAKQYGTRQRAVTVRSAV